MLLLFSTDRKANLHPQPTTTSFGEYGFVVVWLRRMLSTNFIGQPCFPPYLRFVAAVVLPAAIRNRSSCGALIRVS